MVCTVLITPDFGSRANVTTRIPQYSPNISLESPKNIVLQMIELNCYHIKNCTSEYFRTILGDVAGVETTDGVKRPERWIIQNVFLWANSFNTETEVANL